MSVLQLSEEQQRWQAEKAEVEKTAAELKGEVGALQAQREELQATLDTLTAGQPGIDTKVSSGQDDFWGGGSQLREAAPGQQ